MKVTLWLSVETPMVLEFDHEPTGKELMEKVVDTHYKYPGPVSNFHVCDRRIDERCDQDASA